MCLYKNLQADGSSTAECPCPRYIPQEEPQPGPRVCRDCEHWESLHPAAEAPKTSPIAELMARIKPQMDKARHPAPVADEDARRESNAGFKKVSEEHKGRGGATKYQKKGGKSSKSAEKVKTVGQIFFIPDAFFGNPDSSDADDVKDMGVAPVPTITRTQQLKDGGLVVNNETIRDGALSLEFLESWSAEHIDQRWLARLVPHVWRYMERMHQPLQDGEFYWVPLVSHRGNLFEFVKKSPITGSDLETIKAGKGKRTELSSLYFGLRYNVPDKIWLNDAWDDPPSDSDFEEKPAKGKGKARAKPPSTRCSSHKAMKDDDEQSVIEVESDGDNVPSSPSKLRNSESKRKGKTSQRSSPLKMKLEPELAVTPKTDSLFFNVDSDSDADFPDALLAGASLPITSEALTIPVVPAIAGSAATLPSSAPPPPAVTVPSASAPSAIPTASSLVSSTLTASINMASQPSAVLPVAGATTLGSFGFARGLGASTARAPSSGPFGLYSSSSARASGSSSAAFVPSSSSTPLSLRRGIDYAAETAAMESFNKFGNYREGSPKRSFDTAFLESSFKSPERPSYNPWKRRKSA
ncbi:hypothetical protein DFH09DRAFT_1105844 [Mycena vulgaris]|nr:hypothetical protein DFH09DRAFT_1105844 [Mycena vulgaris]